LNVVEWIEISEPSSYTGAVSGKKTAEWTIAMTEEIESLHKNQT